MNFYKHHIGDYAQATAHLTFVEDAAYSRMLRKYYADERPLPADVKAVQRLVGARTREERAAVESVLREFFVLEEDGWHNKRADAEIRKANAQSEANRRVAQEREARRRSVHGNDSCTNHDHAACTNRAPDGARIVDATVHESSPSREPSQTPDTRHQTPDNKEKIKTKTKAAAAAEVFILPEWVPPDDWRAFDEHRRKAKKPMTDRARQLVVMELDKLRKLGHDPAAVLQQSVRRGWLDVFPLKGEQVAAGGQQGVVGGASWARGGV